MEQSVIMGPVDVERLSSQEWAGNWPGPCMRSAAAARAIIVRILGQWTKRCSFYLNFLKVSPKQPCFNKAIIQVFMFITFIRASQGLAQFSSIKLS